MALANFEPASHTLVSPALGRKRKRSEGRSCGMGLESILSISSDDSGVEEEDEALDEETLISKLVLNVAYGTRKPWSVADIERILACVKPGTYEIPMISFDRLAKRVSCHLIFRC
jgi:hypothetical protein